MGSTYDLRCSSKGWDGEPIISKNMTVVGMPVTFTSMFISGATAQSGGRFSTAPANINEGRDHSLHSPSLSRIRRRRLSAHRLSQTDSFS